MNTFHSCRTWSCSVTFQAGHRILILLKPVNILRSTVIYWMFSMTALLTGVTYMMKYHCFSPIPYLYIKLSDQLPLELLIFPTNDPSDYWSFGPLTITEHVRPPGSAPYPRPFFPSYLLPFFFHFFGYTPAFRPSDPRPLIFFILHNQLYRKQEVVNEYGVFLTVTRHTHVE